MTGGSGRDRLYGDNGNDTLFGNQGQDILYGGAGDDFLDGGEESDRLIGNSGRDSFVVEGGDLVYDYLDGTDKLELSNSISFEQLTFTQTNSHTQIKIQTTDEILGTLYNVDANLIDSNDFNLV